MMRQGAQEFALFSLAQVNHRGWLTLEPIGGLCSVGFGLVHRLLA